MIITINQNNMALTRPPELWAEFNVAQPVSIKRKKLFVKINIMRIFFYLFHRNISKNYVTLSLKKLKSIFFYNPHH